MVDTEAAFWMKTPLCISEGKDIKVVPLQAKPLYDKGDVEEEEEEVV